MHFNRPSAKRGWTAVGIGAALFAVAGISAQTPRSPVPSAAQAVLVEIEGRVEVSRAGSPLWDPARADQLLLAGDRVRTGDRSRAVLRLSDQTVLRKGPQTIVEIPETAHGGIRLIKGILYYFHRDKPRDFPVVTPACYAAVVGTEFSVSVAENGATTLHLIDGQVDLTNRFGAVRLLSRESATAAADAAPARTAAIQTVNTLQWCLYYPAIVRVTDLELPAAPPADVTESLQAYQRGDLLRAVAVYPLERRPSSDSERVYFAGLLLAVGQVEQAEEALQELRRNRTPSAAALRRMIAAVKGPSSTISTPVAATHSATATELLADSYAQQSGSSLEAALDSARAAATVAPDFAFAWVRVAELEFSFGRVAKARSALEKGLALAPRHAEAHALQGFLYAAENRIRDALASFDEAIALDGALGNAWLGRGLCRIRLRDQEGGRRDLQVAVVVEPQRAVLRSYLGKACGDARDVARARHELALARHLDAADPTAWLYSALLNQQQNRINDAVRDLEHSQELNDHRAVYRSRLLLDQDRAVRGASLAGVYQDAGLTEVSVREASRAVNADYANYSAHLFLATSFDSLRDPRQVNIRYETPWLSEFLLANLLAPVGAGALSPYVTRHEYSKLFERDRIGIVSSTEYLSRGDWIQTASQFGTLRNSSYALDVSYRSEDGDRPNNDFRQLTTTLTLKQQLGLKDDVLFQAGYYDSDAGDVNQYYHPRSANPGLRMEETQEPFLLAGYHRTWQPGIHTLLLAGRLHDQLDVENPHQETLLFQRDAGGNILAAAPFSIEQRYRSTLELYTVELQQMVQRELATWIVGGRFQTGEFDTQNRHADATVEVPELDDASEAILEALVNGGQAGNPRDVDPPMERLAAYSYLYWRPLDPLLLVGGVSYDYLKWPLNYRYAPLSHNEERTQRVSPKAGLIWTPTRTTTVRGMYARALGGVSFDQSVQLEPTQIAGFVQTYRSLIPESVEGANAAATFETWGASLEETFASGTYLGLTGELLKSKVERNIGAYNLDDSSAITTSQTPKKLDYQERNLTLTANQLLGAEWSVGARYRLSQAQLDGNFAEISPAAVTLGGFQRRTSEEATLHQATLFVLFNHPSGFFAQSQALWNAQHNDGFPPGIGDEDFWQFNAWAGWRFLGRKMELTAGVLNITDRDYKLHPLNLAAQAPRDRTFLARLRFHF